MTAVKAAAKAALDAAADGDKRQLKRLRRTIRQLGNPDYEQYLELRFLQGVTVADATATISGDRTADAVKSLRRRAVRALAEILPLAPPVLTEILDAAAPRTGLAEHASRFGWDKTLTLRLRATILSGQLREGRSLPPAMAFAEHLGISETPIGNAYRQLAHEGYVVIKAGGVGATIASRDEWPTAPESDAGWLVTAEELLEIFTATSSLQELDRAAESSEQMVSSALRQAILSNQLREGQLLPTTEQLSSYLPMSRGPVARAYRQLRIEGYLVTNPWKGTTTVASPDRWPTMSSTTQPATDKAQAAQGVPLPTSVPEESSASSAPMTPPRGHGLSELDVKVLELAAQGRTRAQIAEAAGIDGKKVSYRLERIRVELGVSGGRDEIVAVARQRRIIGTDDDPETRSAPTGTHEDSAASEPSRTMQASGLSRTAEPAANAPEPETPNRAPGASRRPARSAGLIGTMGVPDPEEPIDGAGKPWDRGGPVPRHRRITSLVEPRVDGGGFARGIQQPSTTSENPESDITPEQLDLTPEHTAALADVLAERDQAVAQAIAQVRDLENALAPLLDDSARVDIGSLIGIRAELDAFLDQRMAAYPETAKQQDRVIATLREITARDHLTDSDIQVLAEIVAVKRSGLSAMYPGAKQRYSETLHAAARNRLAELLSDRPSTYRIEGAISTLQSRLRDQAESAQRAWYSGGSSKWTIQRLLDTIGSMRSAVPTARQQITDGWHAIPDDTLAPLLSELNRGLRSRDEVFDAVTSVLAAPSHVGNRVADALRSAERSAALIYAESSVRGSIWRERDTQTIAAFEDAIARVRTLAHLPATDHDLSAEVEKAASERRSDFGWYVDPADTLYLHFTPRISAIAADGMIRSGAHDDIHNTANARASDGVHFIKPGDWRGTETFEDYIGYAGRLFDDNGTRLPDSLGAIIVLPLGAIIAATPLRTEFKTTDEHDGHLASDAAFRPLDRNLHYAYSLDDAYIIPCYTDDQAPWEQYSVTDPETGDLRPGPVADPIRDAFRRAGYDDAWIERHVIDLPDLIPVPGTRNSYLGPEDHHRGRELIRQAQDEIRRQVAEDGRYTDRFVVPLTTEHRRGFEHVDMHGTTRSGRHSNEDLAIERLIITGRYSTRESGNQPSSVPNGSRDEGVDPILELIHDVNPLGNENNCAESAIVTDLRIDGRTNMVAAPSKTGRTGYHDADGRYHLPFIEAHYQTTFQPVRDLADIEDELTDGDHLARGIIVYYDHSELDENQQPRGHAVNAVNDHGTIRYLDGQHGVDVTADMRALGDLLMPTAHRTGGHRPTINAYFIRTDGRYTGFRRGAPHVSSPAPNSPIVGRTGIASEDLSGSEGLPRSPVVAVDNVIDERAALDLPPIRPRRRPFGHMRGVPGLDPTLAFHHNPDNGREWGADHEPVNGEAPRSSTDGSSPGKGTAVELSPSARRVLDAAMSEVEEVAAEALRPVRDLGVDVTSLYRKEAAAIERSIEILRARQGIRFEAVLRRLVADEEAGRTFAEVAAIAGAMRGIRAQYESLAEHIESYHRYADEVRTALAILAARDVLAAEDVEPYIDENGRRVEGIGVGPGRVVVASPLRGQQALLDFLVEGGSGLAAQGVRIDYRLVQVGEDGHVTVEAVSGRHDEPEPIARFYRDRENIVWINNLTDERPFAEKLAEAIDSGESSRQTLKENSGDSSMSESVVQIAYENGFKVIVKTLRSVDQADAEELGAVILQAVGARPPKMLRLSERVIAMEYVPGVVAREILGDGYDAWQHFYPTPAAQRQGLGDTLLRPPDRHEGRNWILERGVHIVPIDNALDFTENWPGAGFTGDEFWAGAGFHEHFTTFDGVWTWVRHHLPGAELESIRQRITAAKAEFERLGHLSWYEDVSRIFTEIERQATESPAPSAEHTNVGLMLEELRDQLLLEYFDESTEGHLIERSRKDWTWRDWRRAVAYLEQRFDGYHDPRASRDIAILKRLTQLHLHAQMNKVSADQLDGTRPELTDEYLNALTQRLADLEEVAQYPAVHGESEQEWLERFDREIHSAVEAQSATSPVPPASPVADAPGDAGDPQERVAPEQAAGSESRLDAQQPEQVALGHPSASTESTTPARDDAAGKSQSAVARTAAVIGGVPNLVNPFDERGKPWDRGGPVARHKRISSLAELHADGGGFARGVQPEPPDDDSRPDGTSPEISPTEPTGERHRSDSTTPRAATSREVAIAREEWALGRWDITSLLPERWLSPQQRPIAVRLISALLDNAFRHSHRARVAMSVHPAEVHCTVTAEGRVLPTPNLPGPQDSWVPELDRSAKSWGFALRREPAGTEVSFVLPYSHYPPSRTSGWWDVVHTDAPGERASLDLTTGVRISRDQRQLVAEVRHAIAQLANAGRSQTLFPELGFSALVDNVFLHTDSDAFVRATMSDQGVLRVEVTDSSHRLPALDQARTPSRGIVMVDDTADAWGVDLHRRGKTVWFEYHIDRSATDPDSDASADLVAGALDDSHDWLDVDVLRSGTAVEIAAWSRRTWQVEMVGFTEPEASRNVARGVHHMLTGHRQLAVRNGAVIAVGKVGDDKGIDVAATRDDGGQVFIESITVDQRLLDALSESAGERLYASVVGAIGGVLVEAGVGVVRERGFDYLYSHYLGTRPERGADDETGFENWLRGQLGESVLRPRSRIRLGRRALSSRFDVRQAARAAVADVELNGWDDASDAARTLYRLLFAQLRSDPESVDLLDTPLPEIERHARVQWGRGSENASDLAAAFSAERGIPVVGAEFPGYDGKKVRAFFRGLHTMWDIFPEIELDVVGFRPMDLSIKATPDENADAYTKEIWFNQQYLRDKHPIDPQSKFGYSASDIAPEAKYRFASVMVAAAGSAVLDDVFPALLTRWLHGRGKGSSAYQEDFGSWLESQFTEFSFRAGNGSPDPALHLDERSALAESVVEVVQAEEPTEGQRMLYSLLMKHLANRHPSNNPTPSQPSPVSDQSDHKQPEPRRPARPAALPGAMDVPDLEDPFGDHGRAWDHGGPGPRRVDKLAQFDAVGGGWPRAKDRQRRARYQTVTLASTALEESDDDDADLDLIRPTVDSRGWFRADGEPYHTTGSEGDPFLLLATGEFVTADASHAFLLEAFLAQGGSLDDISGFGTWTISGRLKKLDTFSQGFEEWNGDPMIPAQILDALYESGADLSRWEPDEQFGSEHRGLLWRGRAAEVPVGDVVGHRGDAFKLLSGYGVAMDSEGNRIVFWVDLASWESATEGESITLIVNSARHEPFPVRIELTPNGESVTARRVVAVGWEQKSAAAVMGLLHEKLTSWLTESGAAWAAGSDTAPSEHASGPAARSASVAPTQRAELIVRAEPEDAGKSRRAASETQAAPETAAAWLAEQLSDWPIEQTDLASATLKAMVTDAVRQRRGRVHVAVETNDELLRVTLLDTHAASTPRNGITSRSGLALFPDTGTADGASRLPRAGIELFKRDEDGWHQAVWFEISRPHKGLPAAEDRSEAIQDLPRGLPRDNRIGDPDHAAARNASGPVAQDDIDPATNPVLAAVLNPAGDPAFDRMKAEHFLPVFRYAMRMQLAVIENIVGNPGPWTADNTLRPFVESGLLFGAVKQLFAQKAAVDRDSATAEAEPVIAELKDAHESRILADLALAGIFEYLHEHRDELDLSESELGYVARKYRDFKNAGAYLSDEKKRRLAEITSEVSVLQTTYKDNQEKAVKDIEIRVDDVEKLRGLTRDQIESARSRAGEDSGYVLPKPPATSTIWHPFLTYLEDPALRQQIYEKVAALGVVGHDNSQNVLDQVQRLAERAEIRGYRNHAEDVMSSGIFDSVPAVKYILDRIARAAATAARIEFPLLAEAIGAEEIRPSDRPRARDLSTNQLVGINEKEIREYFELDRVLEKGVFRVAKDLFELTITELHDHSKPPVWHEDVRVFSVADKKGQHLTNFYFDPYSREGKNGGEWTDPIRLNFAPTGQRPLIGVHMNIEKPPTGRPTLLAPDKVESLFHEFGHALHFLLGEGTHEPAKRHLVFAWIEFVAKVFQQFWKHPDVIADYGVHHQRDEPMPPEMLEKLMEGRTAYRGTETIDRLAGAYIDLAWSSLPSAQVPRGDAPRAVVQEFERAVLSAAGIYFSEIENPYPSQWFRHLFAEMGSFGTYSGQYWSYLLSDVLALIVFRTRINPSIEQHGGLTPETGRIILDEILRYEEDNLVQATHRLIGPEPSVEHFLEDQRLLWPYALLELGTDATPEWLTTPDIRPPGTDLASWWNDRLAPALRAAMIQAFPSEVLAMDIPHTPETVEAAHRRRMTLLEYSGGTQTTAGQPPADSAPSGSAAAPRTSEGAIDPISVVGALAD
ncbi:M3 family metallopeptidase, partial [Nocardia abscessus]|uniref:M3 family metallopeptidase n=1 Tax=Nocardia abscessus TaxID=120957 RepID=UPI0024573DC9